MSETLHAEHLPFAQDREAIANGSSMREVAAKFLKNAKASPENDPFLDIYEEELLSNADALDAKLAAGNAGPLAGMVLSLKDNISYQGHGLNASSKILSSYESIYNATVVERLLASDALIIGRTSCDEFAMGSSNENSAFGPVSNPYAPNCVPGGSSGGSAASVAAGMCHASLGSDTGGSIRQPAAFCGLVGFKPTYGRVSRYGLIAYASSFDQIGPLSNNVEDADLVYQAIAGKDERDSTTSDLSVEGLSGKTPEKLKIAFYKTCFDRPGLDPEIKEKLTKVIEQLKADGHEVEGIELPMLEQMISCYYVLTTAEASSNLARFDGVRYGYRSEAASDVESTYSMSRSEGFGEEVKRRILLGTFVLSAGYYDAYYSKAQKVRRLIRNQATEVLSKYDVVLTPTVPTTAFEKGKLDGDNVAMYLQDIFTVQANLAGFPAISLPVGLHSDGKPMAVQLMGKPFGEAGLLDIAHHVEREIIPRTT